ncbi:hypothetical protein [Moritella sp. F3]|uniref:hypothetical protein n=1 Tax=Moritella sp. F3 TaxID=2718882 RepID=UPI0018E0E0A4|nr:hypothetical protein [Moritella sp. F3]GIC79361.1 hypothetical protein FMO001_40880 [Moritella sp. F1]GIC84080.1 hypothetical protein FMO003_43600 [Moritella sp. F3]
MSDLIKHMTSGSNSDSFLSNISNMSTNEIAISSVIVAIFALFISILSSFVAHRSYKLSEKSFKEDRQMVLLRNFESKELKFKPLDSTHNLANGELYFPNLISNSPFKIDSDGSIIGILSLELKLKQYLSKKIQPKEGVLGIFNANLPVNIKTLYHAKNSSYTDVSAYLLTVQCYSTCDDINGFSFDYKNLTLFSRSAFKVKRLNKFDDSTLFAFNNNI